MANEISLSITTNELDVFASLQRIEAAAEQLGKTPFKLNFDVQGIDKNVVSLVNATAKLTKAQADYNESLQAEKRAAAEAMQAEAALLKQQNALAVETQKTATATENLAKAEEKTKQAVEKTKQTALQNVAAKEKTAQAEEKTKQAVEKTTQELIKQESATKSASAATNTFIGTLSAWAASKALTLIKQQFAEALDTMREVDQELANIAKVSDYSAEEIKRIGSQSYDVASRYGIVASDYLASVADWAKAGYENADQLAELSTKLQLVGDVDAEVASKFLLSADAAWKFGGSIEELSSIIDSANVIENNFATSIDKLAEGLPIVASTASMVGMSAEQTLAAIGTISAATQESGRKSATALRSLILNLMKEVGTVEDGVEVTEESVSKLYRILELYEPAALEAAQATGKIVDPMVAVSALAQAASDGLMSEAEMALYLSEIGGKLRTNQLVALINNQEMYNEMLEKTEDAAGSADKEIEILLEAWNAKTNVLKNTWTHFVSDLIDTEWVKTFIDMANEIVQTMDTLTRVMGGGEKYLGYGDARLYYWHDSGEETFEQAQEAFREWKALSADERLAQEFDEYLEGWKEVNLAVTESTELLHEDSGATEENTEAKEDNAEAQKDNAAAIDEVTDALTGARNAKEAFDAAMKAEEKDDVFKDYADAYKTLTEEIDAGRVNSNAFWASAEFLMGEDVLDQMGRDAEQIIEHLREIAPMFSDADSAGRGLLETMSEAADESGNILDANGNLIAEIHANADGGWDWFIEDADALAEKLGVSVDAVVALQTALGVFSDVAVTASEDAQDGQDDVASALSDTTAAAEDTEDALRRVDSVGMEAITGNVHSLAGALRDAKAAAEEAGEAIGSSGSFAGGGFGRSGSFATGTAGAPGGPSLVNELGPELISDRGRAYIANGGAPGIVNLSRGAVVFNAKQTQQILGSGRAYNGMPAHKAGTGNGIYFENIAANLDAGGVAILTLNTTPGTTGKKTSGSGGGSGSASATSMKDVQSTLDALLKNLKLQAELAKNEGRIGDMNALYQQAQDEIQKVVDEYLKAGYEETSDEVLTLKNLIYDYAGKMEDMAADAWKEMESGLKDILSGIKEKAELAANEGDYARVNDLYREAQNEIQKVIDQYIAAGYAEDSDEIVKLKNQIYDFADKMHDLAAEAWKSLEDGLDKALDTIDGQITLAENRGDTQKILALYQQAQTEIANLLNQYLAAGYAPDSDEVVALANRGYSYAGQQQALIDDLWADLVDAIQGLKDATDDANEIAEKQLAVDEATLAYANAQKQRTVRIFNPASGQWEWVADEAAIQNAQASLQNAQKSLSDAQYSQMLEMLRNGDMSVADIMASEPISAQYNEAGGSAQQAFLSALGAYYGTVNRTGSTEASSAFSTSDSHDTSYNFGGITLSREQAEGMTLAQLADYLSYAGIAS